MSGALALGWRNIWRSRRRTVISMSAIGIGLFLVIFYSGLVAGMLGSAKNQLDDAGVGHVEVTAQGFRVRHDVGLWLKDTSTWKGQVSLPPGAEFGERVLARGLATSARGNEPVQVLGVNWVDEPNLSAHLRHLVTGALPTDAEMGADLFRVRAIFHSVAPAIGQRQIYVSEGAARELIGLEGGAHQLVIQLADPAQADALAASLRSALGPGAEVMTWGELLPVLKRMEALMDNVVFAMAFFVYFLVGLGVLNTMLMSVLERTREFGVLMSLGTRSSRIVQVVLAEAFWIATISVLVGGALGAYANWHFSQAGLQLGGSGESYQLEGATISTLIKTRFLLSDLLKATSFVFVMALIVGLYPASRITRLQPAEALRRT